MILSLLANIAKGNLKNKNIQNKMKDMLQVY